MNRRKLIFTIIAALMLCIPVNVNASTGKIDEGTIVTCEGKRYGSHGSDHHFHQVDNNGKAKGNNLGTDWDCKRNTSKDEVQLVKCIDGDTAKFLLNGEEITTRFLAVDTPETKHPTKGVEPFGPEASKYTCNLLTNASKIYIEHDASSTKTDKYNRHLAWIWADNTLIQEDLVKQGLAKVAYLYGDYKYTNNLKEAQEFAKQSQRNIWTNENIETTDNAKTEEALIESGDSQVVKDTNEDKENFEQQEDAIIAYIIFIGLLLYLLYNVMYHIDTKRQKKKKSKKKKKTTKK